MEQEATLRLTLFLGVLIIVALAESWAPRRQRSLPRAQRWPANLALVLINTVLLRLLVPITAVGWATIGEQRGWGVLNLWSGAEWLRLLLAVVLLDLVIYLQHVLFHALPLLWRLHRVHHADLDLDVSSGLRFHPLEIILSMGIKLAAIQVIGAPATAVLIFETVLNAMAMFNHGNLHIPEKWDQVVRWLLVTPDMHRVHHSVLAAETNSNFGFNLSCWDRLFGSYCPQPIAGHDSMQIGLRQPREKELCQPLRALLWMPVESKRDHYPLNHRW